MTVTPTTLEGVLLIEPRLFRDARGQFVETWNARRYADAGIAGPFVQDNVSVSSHGVLRGLHFQIAPHAQGKLVTVLHGSAYDVAVDLRRQSPTYGQWIGYELSGDNGRQLWIPPGFAHGFVVTSAQAVFSYKCTDFYAPESERSVRWDDPSLAIDWPVQHPILNERDAQAPLLGDLDL
jgi:dTDP-4-dehydrorhamnose 3,5-epimerase